MYTFTYYHLLQPFALFFRILLALYIYGITIHRHQLNTNKLKNS